MTFPSRILMFLLFALMVSLTPCVDLAAEQPASSATIVKENELALEKALGKEVSFAFKEVPLREAAAVLSEQSGINLLVDTKALDEVGIGSDTPVTSRSDGISLRSALRLMLRQMNPTLTYAIHDEVILITTREAAEEKLRTVLYDVQDFIAPVQGPAIRTDEIHHAFLHDFPLAGSRDERLVDAVIELITATLEPDSWAEVGGPGSLDDTAGLLAVSQTQEIHNRIAATLKTLRQVRDAHAKQPGGEPSVIGPAAAGIVAKQQHDEVLAKKLSLDFEDAQLADVADKLTESVNFRVALDTKALDEVGIGSDAPVTIQVDDISFRAALRHMLKTIDPTLTYQMSNEVLLITTREAAEENLVTMIYPVGDLIRDVDTDTAFTYDALIDLITKTVEPDSWDEVGGPGSTAAFAPFHALVVSQTAEVHDIVRMLLDKIRKLREGQTVAHTAPVQEAEVDKDPYVLTIYHFASLDDDGTAPPEAKAARKLPAPEAIAELVEKTIQPVSWQAAEAAVHALPGRLVVRQRVSAHREIFELLRSLRVLRSSPPPGRGFY